MKTFLNLKIEEKVKEDAKIIAQDFGLSMSALVNALLRQAIRERKIELFTVPRMSKKLEKSLDSIEKDIKEGKNLSPKFSTGKDAVAYLDSLGL